jgi:hypothetical protein
MLPPGFARLVAKPSSTTLVPMTMTMGMVRVAFRVARVVALIEVTMTSGLARTKSIAASGSR